MRFQKILCKELKVQFRSFLIFLCFIALGAMLITEVIPKDWRYNAKPMKDSNFIYFQLQKDSEKKVSDDSFIAYKTYEKLKFTREQTDKMKQIMNLMNPDGVEDREILSEMTFAISEDELFLLLDELSAMIGKDNYYNDRAALLLERYKFRVYTARTTEDKEIIMEKIIKQIKRILYDGKYSLYNEHFPAQTRLLSDQEKRQLESGVSQMEEVRTQTLPVDSRYDRIIGQTDELNRMLGGNTILAGKYRDGFLQEPLSYEEAVLRYHSNFQNESLGSAYGRYFSDYMGCLFGLLPPFIASFVMLREKRTGTRDVIYSRAVKSYEFVCGRMLGVLIPFAVGLIILTLITMGILIGQSGLWAGMGKLLIYALFWVLPTIMIFTVLPFFLTLLIGNEVTALGICVLFAFYSFQPLTGDYPFWKPILRFNELGNYALWKQNAGAIAVNRIVMVLACFVLLGLSVLLLERRRRRLDCWI